MATPITFPYKRLSDGQDVEADLYLPSNVTTGKGIGADALVLPAVVWFHGGGFIGDKSLMIRPHWMQTLCTERNDCCFISANYRILVPFTAKDIKEDVCDLVKFLANETLEVPAEGDTNRKIKIRIDPGRIVTGGESFGAYVARLHALHANPKPKALISLYGIAGSLDAHWLSPGKTNFIKDPISDEQAKSLWDKLAKDPVTFTGMKIDVKEDGSMQIDEPRAHLMAWVTGQGKLMDFLSGVDGLAGRLLETAKSKGVGASDLDRRVLELFPDIVLAQSVPKDFPPSLFIHGRYDHDVPIDESRKTEKQLKDAGIRTVFIEVDGNEANTAHGFDVSAQFKGQEDHELWKRMKVDEIEKFLKDTLI